MLNTFKISLFKMSKTLNVETFNKCIIFIKNQTNKYFDSFNSIYYKST